MYVLCWMGQGARVVYSKHQVFALYWRSVGLMLGQHHRHWPNIASTSSVWSDDWLQDAVLRSIYHISQGGFGGGGIGH